MNKLSCHNYRGYSNRHQRQHMKTRYFNRSEDSEINITPMLDVVFIMLIFFIVTTSFTKETGLRIYKASQTKINENKVKRVTIILDTDNITVNGIATKLNGIESLLANIKASNPNIKASNPDIKAQIFSAKDVETGDLVQTIHQIKANGIVSYSVSSF